MRLRRAAKLRVGTLATAVALAGCGSGPRRQTAVRTTAARPAPPRAAPPSVRARALLRLRDPGLTEASGLAAAGRGGLFAVQDSGHAPELLTLDAEGCTAARTTLTGAQDVDWEDLAPGPDGTLWVADIGDNAAARASITLYRVAAPRAAATAAPPDAARQASTAPTGSGPAGCPPPRVGSTVATAFALRFPDGSHDAEALLVDPRTGAVGLVTKPAPSALYVPVGPLRAGATTMLRRAGTVRLDAGLADRVAGVRVTGGAVSPDGRRVVLRTYGGLFAWRVRRPGDLAGTLRGSAARAGVPDLGAQGEAVAFTRDGRALLTAAEGAGTTVYRVPVPGG